MVSQFHSRMVGFLWTFRFPPTPKNRDPNVSLVQRFWYLVSTADVCHVADPQRPLGGLMGFKSRVTNTETANYYYHYLLLT